MGVKGVKALLRGVGWQASWEDDFVRDDTAADPENSTAATAAAITAKSKSTSACGCTIRLWKEWNASDAFLGVNNVPPLQKIPPQSKFLIDGNGLAFYLHSIAYSRYLRSLNTSTTSTSTANCCPRIQTLATSEETVVQALPCMMPLSQLRGITHEFVAALKEQNMQLQVYWDGPLRRHKARTDEERLQYRKQQESHLELFCRHGILPSSKHLRYACQWKDEFPFSRLFLLAVKHALQEQNIAMVQCTEEADVELAKQACGDSQAFILGFDSDFFFFRNVQYIPLNEISIQPSGLYAFCATRTELARLLALENDENDVSTNKRMVDLALMMGNDYVDPTTQLKLPNELQQGKRSPQELVFYLQCNDDFEVAAKDDDTSKAAVSFVRALYNLENLDDDAFVQEIDPSLDDDDDDDTICNLILPSDNGRDGKNRNTASLLPEDASVRDGVIRSLHQRLDQSLDDESPSLITVEVLEAYSQSTSASYGDGTVEYTLNGSFARPTWDEMKAGFFVESCVRQLYHSSPASILTKMTPPNATMNRFLFHRILASYRQSENAAEDTVVSDDGENDLTAPTPISLPIDDHEVTIIETIRSNRVTIIHGETGCGKSSRVPIMLLKAPPPDGSLRKVKFFISQPRRIAAKALVERVRQCEPELRDKFALRMGHGWKEYETNQTQVYFVTTGYLVRLLANHPERFDECTHLVIDEVHERSVDTDILCLLCRRLLDSNKHIRLVLMSATLATKMYQDYFSVPNEPIHVGVRRFPITEYYLEDLKQFGLPEQDLAAARAIEKEIESRRCRVAPTGTELSKRFQLTARLATIVGQPGASVLIFVPGMAEIISISEHIESYHTVGIRYTCFPIHGDIPFEEQMGAFDEPAEDEVKVIIATNAAESSVTLPNVDHVICLGLCRQIIYNQASHRQMLTPTWISQASAKQRAGRTGRVRPGSVYRLYTRNAYDKYLEEFEPGEMVRIPLDSVILMLKQILHGEVRPIFLDCLEPPPLDTIDRSFQSLYRWNFITEPDDKADITSLGAFVSSLGVDLSLGSFIGLGIQFGVAAEAIEMAAMMSLPKTPFQMASPMWMTPAVFNDTASKAYMAKSDMDGGLYSEPMALMNALWDYACASHKTSWCYQNRIAVKRWQQVVSSRNSLRKRVASFLGIKEEKLQLQLPPRDMPREKILLLRLLKVWVFSNSIVECPKSSLKLESDGSVFLTVKSKSKQKLTTDLLGQILDINRHRYAVMEFNESDQAGVFDEEGDFSLSNFLPEFEQRLLSYASEKNIGVVLCHSSDDYYLYVDEKDAGIRKIYEILETANSRVVAEQRYAYKYVEKKRRGFQERAAGLWSIQKSPESHGEFSGKKQFQKMHLSRKGCREFEYLVSHTIHDLFLSDMKSVMKWEFRRNTNGKKKKKSTHAQPFQVSLRGGQGQITKQDMQDLLARRITTFTTHRQTAAQSIFLQGVRTDPHDVTKNDSHRLKPLFKDVPESARILALLASSQRKGRSRLRFPVTGEEDDPEATVDFFMKEEEVEVSKRWRRLDSDSLVYVDESVPATAIATSSCLYAVAANALELQRGGLRVEGLTLLPPNPLFLLLSFLTFGLELGSVVSWITSNDGDDKDSRIKKRVNKAFTWLTQRADAKAENDTIVIDTRMDDGFQENPIVFEKQEIKNFLCQAAHFHEDSMEMGEELVCFPKKIEELCQLFRSVEGTSLSPWETLMDESLTHENLAVWRNEAKSSTSEALHSSVNGNKKRLSPINKIVRKQRLGITNNDSQKGDNNINRNHFAHEKAQKPEQHRIRQFEKHVLLKSKKWFATKLDGDESIPSFPSTNILAMLFQQYRDQILNEPVTHHNQQFNINLNAQQWEVLQFRKCESGETWYSARFVHEGIPLLPVVGRGKNKLPKWIKKQRRRPSDIEDAQQCVPPHVKSPAMVHIPGGGGLMFETLEAALQMEAAFWLEQQYCHASKSTIRHWYMHPMEQMIQILRQHTISTVELK